jgi:D-alanyl-lipoteichoic acid acyltransferase DltB (MBOAT superfamily)
MLFNHPLYGAFLIATWVGFWLLRRTRWAQALFLVLASYSFYVYGTWEAAQGEPVPLPAFGWAVLCLGVIFVGSTIDFFVGRALGRVKRPASRNALLFASIAYYVGVLCIFKYSNFALDSIRSLLAAFGVDLKVRVLRMVLPFGISFFTFEAMSYTIDVWRGQLEPSRRYLDYLLFICFFPHLVAGPIVRPGQMLPQLAAPPRADALMQARGLWRIATGLTKKIVIGDYLAQAIVDRVFDAPERFTALEVLLATYGYAALIYADFSGYSDVAIGSAALFGYELPENFDVPYLARNLQEFWRRWHMSLSSWLRDYLYKPLGGSRAGPLSTYRNLFLTMVLGGLWHGAAWTFVVWGALHGGALAATRMWQRARESQKQSSRGGPGSLAVSPSGGVLRQLAGGESWSGLVGVLLTFHFVCFGWIFFRAPSLAHASLMVGRIAGGPWRMDHVGARVVTVIAAAALLHLIPRSWDARVRDAFARTPALVQGLVLAAFAVGLHLAAGTRVEPFVYGQF